ncbi:MAG: triose-phosphate isomerase [Oscillospiraceae bacterium]|nr:triose-phosphate isomerase [Oscillospiraceae bacterium]
MPEKRKITPPFFEIGPKSYLYGDDVIELAIAADKASEKYGVNIIFTTPVVDIRRVKENTKNIFVFAPHMDPLYPGRGLADTLPESLVAAGADGVMLNHCEKPLEFDVLKETIARADEVGLTTIVCADSLADASKIATLKPDIIVAEPSELIGTGVSVGPEYVEAATKSVKDVDSDILVLTAAGISNGEDVYNTIISGADATGSSSGIAKAEDRAAMVDEMIAAVARAYSERHDNK